MSKVPDRARPTITTRLGVSLPTAVGALLFAGAIAFGSGMVGAPSPWQGSQDGVAQGGDYRGNGGLNPGQGHDKPKPPAYNHPDKQQPQPDKPKPEQQPQPDQPKPETEQQPKPDKPKPDQPKPDKPKPPTPTGPMQLQAQAGIGKVKLTWSKFAGEGFGYYKVVRSTDATVTWPMGSGDTLVGWSHDKYQNWFKDFPPCGTPFHYAVFAVTGGDSGHQLLATSNVVSATAECETPKPPPPPPTHPEPTILAFIVSHVDGGVHLDWEMCTGTGFTGYQVVRSMTNPDPNFPLNAGTELVATIGNANTSALVDTNVTTGQTWYYRVVSMGSDAGGAFVLGLTPVVSVTVP
jgi:hypothetical protein